MLKLTRSHSPYPNSTLWVVAAHITVMERAEDHTNIWFGSYCHCVTETPEEILSLMAPPEMRGGPDVLYYDTRTR